MDRINIENNDSNMRFLDFLLNNAKYKIFKRETERSVQYCVESEQFVENGMKICNKYEVSIYETLNNDYVIYCVLKRLKKGIIDYVTLIILALLDNYNYVYSDQIPSPVYNKARNMCENLLKLDQSRLVIEI